MMLSTYRPRGPHLAYASIFVLFLSAFGITTQAHEELCSTLLRAEPIRLRRDGHPLENAAEIETGVNSALRRILTSEDGTLGPILSQYSLEEFPKLKNWIRRRQQEHAVSNLNDLKWDALSDQQIRSLYRSIGKSTLHDNEDRFYESRVIPGLRLRESFAPPASKPFELWGRLHSPGDAIELSPLERYVEYTSPQAIAKFDRAELHLRMPWAASRLYREALQFISVASLPRDHWIHIHITANIPTLEEILQRNASPLGEQTALSNGIHNWALFLRNTELLAHLLAIDSDGSVYNNDLSWSIGNEDLFYYSHQNTLFRHYRGGSPLEFAGFKGFVSTRGSDTYDHAGLWGIEYRDLPYFSDPQLNEQLLQAIETKLESQNYLTSQVDWEKWKLNNIKHVQDNSTAFWYLEKRTKRQLRDFHPVGISHNQFLKYLNNHFEFYMLVHKWETDPLFFDDDEAIQKIQTAQIEAWRELYKPMTVHNPLITRRIFQVRAHQAMKTFIHQSGLLARLKQEYELSL